MRKVRGRDGTNGGIRHAGITVGSALVRVLLAAMAASSASAQDAPEMPIMSRSFEVRSVDSRVVETWVWDLCEEHPGEECHVIGVAPGNPSQLSVRGSAKVIAEVARLLAERDATFEQTQTFQIMLVAGSRGGGMDPTLPANAIAALDDVEQFLPFDSFRLLDTALLISTRSGKTMLSGSGGMQYEAGLRFRRVQSVEGPMVLVELLRVSESTRSSPELGEGESRQVGGILIDTSISMKIGETAVVGTSKLNGGDEALIVLLTALPSS